ncbi:PEPxxWA-CTERM sorting domain-containing protein [Sandaracinobacteroides saxicola]|uniref:PEP-CTERM sorting domain-containing protein n=1 Tax=Sandaracinobacteroides saxicola TaxID=2759707 RepID=A0A7G5IJI6_9SPHN|nr:PEPxxWA-CTERM sorting domain-containing protein [Sandaracinobacteroides saxicola]QMW23528.1 PEP-CTERM sorting domain-containing protein [Sandaracinobacteroides saxicola]
MKTLFVAAALALAAPAAAVTTVTFDTQSQNYYASGTGFTDSGYTFTSNQDAYNYLWDGSSPNSNGTINLISSGFFGNNAGWTITKAGGGSFKLISFDIAISWYSSATAASMTAGGATVNYTPTLTTYVVNQTGSSVTLSNGLSDGYWSADNFVFGAVPEASTWAMLISGFGLVGAGLRRRRALAA